MSCILQPEIKVKSFIGDGVDSGVELLNITKPSFLGTAFKHIVGADIVTAKVLVQVGGGLVTSEPPHYLIFLLGNRLYVQHCSTILFEVWESDKVLTIGEEYSIHCTFTTTGGFVLNVDGSQAILTSWYNPPPFPYNPIELQMSVGRSSYTTPTQSNNGVIYDFYYSIDPDFALPSSIAQYTESPNPEEDNRPFYTGKELFTQEAPDVLPSAWLGGAVQGEVIIQPEIIDPNCINRDPHKFDNLNWVVSVTSEGEPFLNLDGVETQSFNFCTIPENETYFTIPNSFNYVDQDLRVETIQNGFSDGIHKNSLAPIPTASFSISNLELFYHRLCEINGDDLNVFEGAKIEIYMVNGLNPLVVWDSVGEVWNKFDNTLSDVQEQRPTIISPNYPTNEEGYLIFTGTIEDIGFSTQTTSFDCLGVADKINVSLGNLIDPLAQKKDRGGIFPITFGDWSSENDLMPIVLNRNQENVPKIILGEYAHDELNSVRLYDKVSEKDFEVKNDFTIATDKNIVQFKNETATDTLGKALNDDINTYDESQQITNLRDSLFQNPNTGTVATKQALYSVGDELIAYHTPRREPKASYLTTHFGDLKGQISASRGWGGQGVTNHEASAELFEIDSEYQKAIALIDIAPKITGLYWSGKDVLNPTNTSSCGFTTGSFQNVIDKTSKSETDSLPDLNAFAYAGSDDNEFTTTDFFSFEFEKIGLNGEIIKTDCDYSGWFYGGNDFISPSTSQDYTIAMTIKNLDDSALIEDQNRLVFTTDIENSDLDLFTRQVKGDYQNLTSYELISPSGGWLKVKYSVDLTTPDLTTLEQLQEGRIGISCDTIDRLTPNSPRNFFDYLNWRFRVKVNAEDGLWFGRGKGRIESDVLITSSPNAIKDIMTKELGYSPANFGSITSNRDNFPCAFSLFGKQKKWREELKKICFSFGIGSYQSFDGKENLIDFDRRTPDAVISPDMVLLSGGMQSINYSFTDRNDLFNEFLIKYKVNPANKDTQAVLLLNESEIKNTEPIQFLTAQQTQALQSKLSRATKRLGLTNNEKKQFLLESEYFRDGETAERMLNLFILWNTSTKAKVKVEGTYSDFFDLDVGFQVIFEENAFGGLPKKIAESQFLVINKTIIPSMDGGGSIELDLIEMPTEGV